jgi:hypothetical protein
MEDFPSKEVVEKLGIRLRKRQNRSLRELKPA